MTYSATWADFEKSLSRCLARRRVLITLASLSISYPGPLAKAAGVKWDQLMGVMHGAPPKYRIELALIPMGLVRQVSGPNGRAFEITDRGRRKARQLTARTVRDDIRRRAVRGDVGSHMGADPGGGGGPHAGRALTATFAFSIRQPPPPETPPPRGRALSPVASVPLR